MTKVLDAFCHKGGAGMGYYQAGYDVTGIDIVDTSNEYPFKFIQGDAIEYILRYGWKYDFIHASPPCQFYTALTKGTNQGNVYENLIPPTREALQRVKVPWMIENVAGAELRKDLRLCGEMFGLGVLRHRFFEFSEGFEIPKVKHPQHRGRVAGMRHGVWYKGPYFAVYGDGGGKGTIAEWQQAMGIPWISDRLGLAQAIPPAYTKWIAEMIVSPRLSVASGVD